MVHASWLKGARPGPRGRHGWGGVGGDGGCYFGDTLRLDASCMLAAKYMLDVSKPVKHRVWGLGGSGGLF